MGLFDGIHGWHARTPPADRVAIEWDADATRTLHALGVPVIRADVAAYPAEVFAGRVEGITASPPCQSFSSAGKRGGLSDPRGQLVFEPLRWALAVRPRWLACEQVPEVLGIWRDMAHDLEALGYRCWSGVLSAERYGVPQTRSRAILMASLDRVPTPPAPTHQEYVAGRPAMAQPAGMFHDGELPWVSMAEALGWPAGRTVDRRQTGAPVLSCDDAPCPTMTTAVMGKGVWSFGRPATTLTTDARGCPPPGHHDAKVSASQWGEGAIRLTVAEALVLQSFPADYPVQGTKTAAFRQVGNAIPPLLAARILEAVR